MCNVYQQLTGQQRQATSVQHWLHNLLYLPISNNNKGANLVGTSQGVNGWREGGRFWMEWWGRGGGGEETGVDGGMVRDGGAIEMVGVAGCLERGAHV